MNQVFRRKNIYIDLLKLIEKGESCALATVTATHGSTPQKPGSSALIDSNGIVSGTVGGGITEHVIKKKAIESIHSKESGYFSFDLDKDISDPDAAICGGGMSIVIDSSPEKYKAVFDELRNSIYKRIPGVLLTFTGITTSGERFLKRKWITKEKENLTAEKAKLKPEVVEHLEEMLAKGALGDFREINLSSEEEIQEHIVLIESIVPQSRLILAGAGHVGKALSHLAALLQFEVFVWDDRQEFANKENLPDADKIITGELNVSFGKIEADRDTYVVIATRGHKNDSEVLRHFIRSDAGYIGMMGSKKKVAQVRENFINNGWATPEEWEKVYTPIGLKINSKTVQEIAVSIAAQLIQVRDQLNKVL